MPISGLVIVLTPKAARDGMADGFLESMRSNLTLTIGERANDRIPVVLETATAEESRSAIERLRNMEGVALVEVTYVDFADAVTPEPTPGRSDDGG